MVALDDSGTSDDQSSVGSSDSTRSPPQCHSNAARTDCDSFSDDESGNWILDEIQQQIDDQLQAEIDNQLEEQLWKEMDEHLEHQLDEQIQQVLDQQFDDFMCANTDHLHSDSMKPFPDGHTVVSLETTQRNDAHNKPNAQTKASVSTINAQIQQIVDQYAGLNLKFTNG